MATILEIDRKLFKLKDLVDANPSKYDVLRKKLHVSWIFHENALEGVVLTEKEIVTALTSSHIIADTGMMALFRSVKNHERTLEFVEAEANKPKLDISLPYIKRIHSMLVEGDEDAAGGRYRQEMPLHRTYFHDIQQPKRISYHMNKLVARIASDDCQSMHPTRLAVFIHYSLMTIFPFTEQSGKVARLLMNLVLMHHGYMPAIIPSVDRQIYYEALKTSESALLLLCLDALDNALASALRFFELSEAEIEGAI